VQFNVADLYEALADAFPEREALVVGERRLSFAELDARANRLAHHLEAAGVGPDEHVGLHLYNGTEYVEAMLAAFKIRAVPINVNYRYVQEELRYLFGDADLVAVVHQREFAPRIADIRPGLPKLRVQVFVEDGSGAEVTAPDAVEYEAALAGASPERGFPERSGDDLFVIYTGGTTGMPKGVMWRQEDLFFAGMAGANPGGPPPATPEQVLENARARSPLTMFPVPPLIHGAAQLGTFIGLLGGNRVVLVPRFDADAVWRCVERERVHTMSLVGDAMARPLAEALAARDYDASSLLVLSSAGAIFSDAVKDQLRARLPKLALIDGFGASETGFQGLGAPGSSPEKGLRFQMNASTTVLDDALRPVAPGSGVVGRVALRGRIPLGYYNDPRKTAATFVEHEGERWVLPGDLATVEADGSITVFGRGSVCVNSGGEKIFPEEVEAVLKAHPDVFDAVVVGVPDARWGERVAAVVQARPGTRPAPESLDAHCRAKLAGYKVPREVHFVDTMVRSPSGKPDYPWARALAAGRAGAGR
jgi:acyl-CoA synthetase (AMP-forming)/AMP-acid ligase II